VHHRYATEIVGAFKLCPFMHDVDTAFGVFCVILDHEPDLVTALHHIDDAPSSVVHLVYPLVTLDSRSFERFGGDIHRELARRDRDAPVHASFHPQMEGGSNTSGRLVGLLRRAPDPFVQIVPAGLHEGGTVFVDAASMDPMALLNQKPDPTTSNFERLDEAAIAEIESRQREIHAQRDTTYAPFLKQLS
jgi:hypothetical protein